MGIMKDKLMTGKLIFEASIKPAFERGELDEHTGQDVGILWADERIKLLEANLEELLADYGKLNQLYTDYSLTDEAKAALEASHD